MSTRGVPLDEPDPPATPTNGLRSTPRHEGSGSRSRRRTVAKTRDSELAKQYGISSKDAIAKLSEMGEFVKTASSTIELPVEMKFKKAYGEALLAAKSTSEPAQAEQPADKPAAKRAAKKAAAPAEVEEPAPAVADAEV